MNKLILLSLITSFCFPLILKAEDINLPIISKPSLLQEGTQTTLSEQQINELLPWAKSSLNSLNDLTSRVEGLVDTEKLELLLEGVNEVVKESKPNNSELLMRYVLSRALVINDILSNEMKNEEVGTIDIKLRVIEQSIEMAKKYYNVVEKRNKAMALFGLDYFHFLSEIDKSIFDISAQFSIEKTAFEWLQWDLYRETINTVYAPQIVKINNTLNMLSKTKINESQLLVQMRQLKKLEAQLHFADWIKTIPDVSADLIAAFQKEDSGSRKEVLFKREIPRAETFHRNKFLSTTDLNYFSNVVGNGDGYQVASDEITLVIPIVETGDLNHPINWAATMSIIKSHTLPNPMTVNGKTEQVDSGDGVAQYMSLGVQARKTINDYVEAVMRANYAQRGGGTTMYSKYSLHTGKLFDPYQGVNISGGIYFFSRFSSLPVVYGAGYGINLGNGEKVVNVMLGFRFK